MMIIGPKGSSVINQILSQQGGGFPKKFIQMKQSDFLLVCELHDQWNLENLYFFRGSTIAFPYLFFIFFLSFQILSFFFFNLQFYAPFSVMHFCSFSVNCLAVDIIGWCRMKIEMRKGRKGHKSRWRGEGRDRKNSCRKGKKNSFFNNHPTHSTTNTWLWPSYGHFNPDKTLE